MSGPPASVCRRVSDAPLPPKSRKFVETGYVASSWLEVLPSQTYWEFPPILGPILGSGHFYLQLDFGLTAMERNLTKMSSLFGCSVRKPICITIRRKNKRLNNDFLK